MLQFIHGKVFIQTGRGLRPAKIVFEDKDVEKNWERLSAKDRPKGRGRKKANSHTDHKMDNKEISPSKPVAQFSPNSMHSSQTEEMKTGTESEDDASAEHPLTAKTSAQLTSSPKSSRQTKSKVGSTSKTRDKAHPPSGSSSSAKQLSFLNIPVNNASAQSDVLKLGDVEASKTSPVLLENEGIVEASRSFRLTSLSSSVPVEVYDESAILPPDPSPVDVPISDFSSLSEVLRREEILQKEADEEKNIDKTSIVFADRLFSEASEVSSEKVEMMTENRVLCSIEEQNKKGSPVESSECRLFSHFSSPKSCEEPFKSIIEDSPCPVSKSVENLFEFSLGEKRDESVDDALIPVEEVEMEVVECESKEGESVVKTGGDEEVVCKASDDAMEVEEQDAIECERTGVETMASWTREEDKIILQTFQQEGNSEQTFIKINQQLPARSLDEVRNKVLLFFIRR